MAAPTFIRWRDGNFIFHYDELLMFALLAAIAPMNDITMYGPSGSCTQACRQTVFFPNLLLLSVLQFEEEQLPSLQELLEKLI